MSQVTSILRSIDTGNPNAAEELLPLVYEELRRLAASKMRRESPVHTLQPTALVHEAWLKLAGSSQQKWTGRSHFLSAAAEAMRRILVESARRKKRLKRGGGEKPAPLDELQISAGMEEEHLLFLDEALSLFAEKDPNKALIVKLRYFVGMKHAEIAALLGLSEKTVKRHWHYAKAWLYDAICSSGD